MRREEMFLVLKTNMKSIIGDVDDAAVTEASSLTQDFGADSLQVVDIISRTMRSANVRVKRTVLNEAKNIGQLLDILCAASDQEVSARRLP